MKKKGNSEAGLFRKIKNLFIISIVSITFTMSMINYIRTDASAELGTVYDWTKEAEEFSNVRTSADSNDIYPYGLSFSSGSASESVNINTAGEDELQLLPGIGPSRASAIIDYRNKYGGFICPEELKEVKGIGESIFNGLKDHITIE